MGNARNRKVAWAVVAFALLVGGWVVERDLFWFRITRYERFLGWAWTSLRDFQVARPIISQLLECAWQSFEPTFIFALAAATIALPTGFAVRWLARGRARAGLSDPLDPARRWMAAHPKIAAALAALPAIAWAYELQVPGSLPAFWSLFDRIQARALHNVPVLFATFFVYAAIRLGLRALLAPTLAADEAPASAELSNGDIVFNAVAVTRETRAAVGGMAALSAAFSAAFVMLPVHTIQHDPRAAAAIAAYAAIALGGAAIFRKASRIAVGLDGVLVTGTSKTRFFAYRDVDDARVDRGDVILVRGIREVLRLQLHGDDAARREAIVAKMRAAIARAKEGKSSAPAQIVSVTTADCLARTALGGAEYREPALTREQLWSLVLGPEIDGRARRAAAAALAATGSAEERARLRVAADQCAEPQVRVAIRTIAGDDEDEEGGAIEKMRMRRT